MRYNENITKLKLPFIVQNIHIDSCFNLSQIDIPRNNNVCNFNIINSSREGIPSIKEYNYFSILPLLPNVQSVILENCPKIVDISAISTAQVITIKNCNVTE